MIKRYLFGTISFLVVIGTTLAAPDTGEVRISLETPPQQGQVVVMLFNSPEAFEGFRSPFLTQTFEPGLDVWKIEDLPAGRYALVVYHDRNKNRRLDVNVLGIPREPIGFANQYSPRGPPSFDRASLNIEPRRSKQVDVDLVLPLGDLGRIGIGAGVTGRGNPYKGTSARPWRFLPAVTYIGNRLQITGPSAQLGIVGTRHTRLAATLSYRMGVYDSDDSSSLTGMASRRDTAMGGLRMQVSAPLGLRLHAGYTHDVLDRIGGGQASAGLARSIPWHTLRVTPSVTANWNSASLMRHDFGVTSDEALPDRPVYHPGSAMTLEANVALFAEITPSLFGIFSMGVEWFDRDIRESPIVDEDYVFKGMAFLSYVL